MKVVYSIFDHPEKLARLQKATGKTVDELKKEVEALERDALASPANFTFINNRPKNNKKD